MSSNLDPSVRQACADRERLEALRRYSILDTPREEPFDDITRLVAFICETPIALISFVDESRQWFKSSYGIDAKETDLGSSICAHAMLQPDVLVVPDTLKDARFANNPLVHSEPHLRFYAGSLLQSIDGQSLGTLCVLDTKPRTLSDSQIEALRILARQVMMQLELRRSLDAQRRMIDAQHRTEIELQLARDAAEAANESKDRFLAFLSHELRTPLTPVLLTASSIAFDERLPEDIRADAAMISRNVEHQTRLVDDLLDVTRLSAGKLELRADAVDLEDLIQTSVRTCCADSGEKQLKVLLDLKTPKHQTIGDSSRLQQVFCNLLRNAVKFTPAGGTIQVQTRDGGDGTIETRITDSGIGIDPQLLPNIFEPFQQGSKAITQQYGGLGLGLAISKGIVDRHSGTIEAHSGGAGTGATFIVRLPLAVSTADAPPRVDPSESASTPQRASILLVDDHEDTLRAMSRLLKRSQHRVVTACSVYTALEAAKNDRFDIVVSDLGLPDGTGLDLMRELLGQRPIKGIAVTGYGMEADIDKSRAAGFAAHLTKPVNVRDLEAAINQLLQ